jgi:hypothetical protein
MGTKKTQDLPAGKQVKGGGHNLNANITLIRAAKPARKDLAVSSSKPVSGGRGKRLNDNSTLARVK